MGKKGRNKDRGNMKEKEKEKRRERHKERMEKKKYKKKKDKQDQQRYLDDMQKFKDELIQYGLRILEVGGDGNCLFRSISDQLEGTQSSHRQYRQDAVDYMVLNKDDFAPFIEDDQTFDDYIDTISEDGEWGGNLELQALSMKYQFNAIVHQLDAPVFALANFDPKAVRTIHLTYHLGEHYNSVRLIDDYSTNEVPMDIPLNLQKDPERLAQHREEEEAKLKENGRKFKRKYEETKIEKEEKSQKNGKNKNRKQNKSSSQEEHKGDDKMGATHPCMIQYANTITGLPEFHLMKDALTEIFGEDGQIEFENIDDMKQLIIQTYADKELEFINSGLGFNSDGEDDKDTEATKETNEEAKEESKSESGFTAEEITKHLKKGEIYTEEGEWRRPPNKNKKCYCKSGRKYKICCMASDNSRIDHIVNGKDRKKQYMKIEDAEAKDFLASLVTI